MYLEFYKILAIFCFTVNIKLYLFTFLPHLWSFFLSEFLYLNIGSVFMSAWKHFFSIYLNEVHSQYSFLVFVSLKLSLFHLKFFRIFLWILNFRKTVWGEESRWQRNRTGWSLSLLQIHWKNNRTVNKVYKTTSDR